MDVTIHALIENVSLLSKCQDDFEAYVNPSLTQGEEATQMIEDILGEKPRYLQEKFNAPSLWSSIGLLSSEIHNVSNLVNFELAKELKRTHDSAVTGACTIQEKSVVQMNSRMDKISKSLLNLTQSVQEHLDSHRHSTSKGHYGNDRNENQHHEPQSDVSSSSSDDMDDDMDDTSTHRDDYASRTHLLRKQVPYALL